MTDNQQMIIDEIVSGKIVNYFQFQMKMDICGCNLTKEMTKILTDLTKQNVYYFIKETLSYETPLDDILIKDDVNFCRLISNHNKWMVDYFEKINIWFILEKIFKRRPGLIINYYLKGEKNFTNLKLNESHDLYEYFLLSKCKKYKENLGKYYNMIIEKSKHYHQLKTFLK